MAYPLVLARGFRGEPLQRFLVAQTDRAGFLVAPDHLEAVEAGESGPAGFPIEDVFQFDAGLYERLSEQWASAGRTDDALWRSAIPYAAPQAAA